MPLELITTTSYNGWRSSRKRKQGVEVGKKIGNWNNAEEPGGILTIYKEVWT